jgi:hypothetical protein
MGTVKAASKVWQLPLSTQRYLCGDVARATDTASTHRLVADGEGLASGIEPVACAFGPSGQLAEVGHAVAN